ncbi:DUF2853 family protein [Haloflavibacter putidus]|uniref:DUF2853 family protein n=1 Tax=Haloflavibacter putidus TaxID=2576776 RepID=A0A507ZUF0_9FLAO|nr:DUF2853 family protein [Haloflavibacter putidus]TQD40113.1 DUF2853 family protein [Haloflavibacter putidus]
MSKLDELVGKYIEDANKIESNPDVDLIRKIAKSMGPSIYNQDASTVSSSDKKELETVKKNFLMKKLGLSESDNLDEAIDSVMEKYGKSNRNKYRVVVYYLLAKHFNKESIYK